MMNRDTTASTTQQPTVEEPRPVEDVAQQQQQQQAVAAVQGGDYGKTLLQMLDMFPPWLVITLARDLKTGRALAYKEISHRSGVCMRTICRMAHERTWADHSIQVVSAVLNAAGFNPSTWPAWKSYILNSVRREKPFRYLSRKKRRLKKLLVMVAASRTAGGGAVHGGEQEREGQVAESDVD